MNKLIKRIKITTFIIAILELILIAGFAVFYLNNFFGFKDLIKEAYVVIGAVVLVFINILILWISILRVSSLRKKSDLKAAEVIGKDVQEAYNFGMLGLVVTDDNDIVLWTNTLFSDRKIEIINTNILDWHKDLLPLKDPNFSEESVKIIINSRNYEVKFLSEAGLWIFKDITDYESIYSYSVEQAPVVGILAIDNYDDVVKGDEDFNDIIGQAKNLIFNYCKDNGILLRRIKEDTYSMLCNYDSFTKIKADRFSIINKIRNLSKSHDLPLTISIGIAHDFPDVIKLNELATTALDIAMSRGGDQVVVSAYGSEMEFFGGKSEASEKRNRVKTRVLADSLISLFKGASNILIMGHSNMDMDALGACLGVKTICDRLDINAQIVMDSKLTEKKTRAAIASSFTKGEIDKSFILPSKALQVVQPNTLLVVVDVHTPSMTMAPSLLDEVSKIVVIDHHRRGEDYIENPVFNHIDAASSSTCEIIAEFIKYSSINPRVEIPSKYATIMLAGIFLDSMYFKSKATGVRTFEAATVLKDFGADNAAADDFLKDDFEEHQEIMDIISHLEHPAYGFAIAYGDEDSIYDQTTIAKAANYCLTFKGIHGVFVLGRTSAREIRVSGRSDGSINIQLLAEKLGGGGHYTAAAATIDKPTIKDAKVTLEEVVIKHLSDAANDMKSFNEEEE